MAIYSMAALPNHEKYLECQTCKSLCISCNSVGKLCSKIEVSLGVSHTPKYLSALASHLKGQLVLVLFKVSSVREMFIASDLVKLMLRFEI